MSEPTIQRGGYNATPAKAKEEPDEKPGSAEDVAKKGAVDALKEAGLMPADKEEGLKERLDRERQERILENGLKDFARQQEKPDRPPNFANPKRQEEAVKRTSVQLNSPAPKVEQRKVEKGGVGEGIEFYCFKDGVVGKITMLTDSGFAPLTS